MSSSLLRCLFAALVGVAAVPSPAEQIDRRDRLDPELIIESGGRMGTCDALAFTDDGKQLLAVGDDKVVRVWDFADGNLRAAGAAAGGAVRVRDFADGKLRPGSPAVLRWSIWREQRGAIYALALSPDVKNQYVAVGGLGSLTTTVTVLDRFTGDIVHTVSPAKKGENYNAVWSVAFAPSGHKVAFGTGDGSVFFWDFKECHWCGRHTPRAGRNGINSVLLVRFLDEKTVLSVAEDGTVSEWDTGGAAVKRSDRPGLTEGNQTLARAALSRDGKWLAGAVKWPLVVVRSLDAKQRRDIKLNEGEYGRGLAFDPRNSDRLAVGVGSLVKSEPQFHVEADEAVRLFDLSGQQAKGAAGPPHTNRCEAFAFHPAKNFLAVAGGDNHEITLWDLDRPKEPASVMRGVGTCLWSVAVSRNGEQVAFQDHRDATSADPNHRGKGDWRAFDLLKRKWVEAGDFKPAEQFTTAGGWTVQPHPTNPRRLIAVNKQGKEFLLESFEKQEEFPNCYTFIPAADGKPTRLAVGHYWGLSVYELTDKGPRRTRVYAGHQGEVMALAASADGSWVVSASNDQTLAAWNINDVFKSQPILGAKFAVERADGRERLLVKKVDVGSPAWEAGLLENDEVIRFVFTTDKSTIFETDQSAADRDAALRMLENPVPGREHYFLVRRAGRPVELLTTARQRPVLRFFPTRDGEWALWMWRSSFYDCSTKGDSYIGWHVNAPVLDEKPKFYPAERFREQLERKDVINRLLENRDVAAALREAEDTDNPQPLSFAALEPPAVTLALGPNPVKTQDVKVTVTVAALRTNTDYRPERAELWVNDYRVAQWKGVEGWEREKKGGQFSRTWTLPNAKLKAGDNVVTFQVYNYRGGRAEVAAKVVCQRPRAKPRLFVLAVGVNDYSNVKVGNARNNLLNLRGASNDAKTFVEQWQRPDDLYAGKPVTIQRLDDKATRDAVLVALKDVADQAGPEDNVVVLFAGHGLFVERKVNKGEAPRSTFVFCGPDFDLTRTLETGLSSEVLYDKLAMIAGHKVVILDACHSGEAAVNPVRGLVPGGLGPVILAACDRNQFSFEFPKDDPKNRQHGLFTYAILQALGEKFAEADVNHTGVLDAVDLFEYTKKALPGLLKEIKQREHAQQPIIFAPESERVPLAKANGK
jgi:WD40 repeat protein